MRRAGMDVKTVSITSENNVTGAHGIPVKADLKYHEVDFITPEWLIIPGGMPGAENLSKFGPLNTLLVNQAQSGKIAAICAAPMIFGHMGLLEGKPACIYPGMEAELKGANVVYDNVVRVENVITSRGMGTAIAFGLQIVAELLGESAAQELANKIVYQ